MADLAGLAYQSIQCLPLTRVWQLAVNTGICTDGFSGLTNVWIVSLVNCFMLFGAMVSATIFMPMLIEPSPIDSAKVDEVEDAQGDGQEERAQEDADNETDTQPHPQSDIEMSAVGSLQDTNTSAHDAEEKSAAADSDPKPIIESNNLSESPRESESFGMAGKDVDAV